MKRNLILMAALLLTSTLLTSCFKDRPDTSKQGLYVGIIGFNKNLTTRTLEILNDNTKDDMKKFINDLAKENGSILYHAVNTALDNIESVSPPKDLVNVTIITFTDGQDNGSYDWNENYNSGPEYLTAISNRIRSLSIGDEQVPISAFSIGLKGADVIDEDSFRQTLAKLSSDGQHNVFLLDNMSQMEGIFDNIAQDLHHQCSSWVVTLKISAPEPGSRIRFTFDDVTSAEESQLYIEGVYNTDNNESVFNVTTYYGMRDCGSEIYPETDQDRLKILTFNNLLTNNGEPVSAENTKLWTKVNDNWYPNSEFNQGNNSEANEELKSAMIMMVLDCSSSLGDDFQSMKNSARQFIEALNGSTQM